MAVGKKTAAKCVRQMDRGIDVDLGNPAPLLQEIRKRGYDQNTADGFAAIQRLFIEDEIRRYELLREYPITIVGTGAEEIEACTLFMPRIMGIDRDIASLLKNGLEQLRQCVSTAILYLDADLPTLHHHKEDDSTPSCAKTRPDRRMCPSAKPVQFGATM